MAHVNQAQDTARFSSSGEELRPIRIGAMAIQPAPDQADVLYVGLTQELPAELRALCSCAGLFYARVLGPCKGGWSGEVAALSRYFAADRRTCERHVRSVIFSQEQFEMLVAWDRHFASMATSDLGELVAGYAAQVRRRVSVPVAVQAEIAAPVVRNPSVPSRKSTNAASTASLDDVDDDDVVGFERIDIEVPAACLQVLNEQLCRTIGNHQYLPSNRRMHLALLQSCLEYLQQERFHTKSWQRKRELHSKEQCLRQARALRDLIPLQLEIMPLYARGKHGQVMSYRVSVDVAVLTSAAAA